LLFGDSVNLGCAGSIGLLIERSDLDGEEKMGALRRDPAERSSYLRYFYKGWRPTRLGRFWSALLAWVNGLGLRSQKLVTLEVWSDDGARMNSTILVSANYEGQRYLVSMLGDGSDWVKNVRAAGGKASIKQGRSYPVTLVEIPPRERAPILKAWAQVATSGRKHLPVTHDAPVSSFEAIAADYPVFCIVSQPQPGNNGIRSA
jgi:hypothetical protein